MNSGNYSEAITQDAGKDPDRLAREIDEQRREINETLRALEEKFSSREIASQFMQYFGGPGREWAGNLGSSVKANPIPTLLTAIGVTWLMMSDRSSAPVAPYSSYGADVSQNRGRDMFNEAASSARETADSLKQKAGALGDKATHAGEALGARAAHAGETLRSRVSHTREGLHHSTASVRNNFEHMVRDQPLALGAVGIALGALIGAALPRTEHERRMLGQASERVMEKGKEMAREGYEKASEKVAEVAQAAEETLQRHTDQNAQDALQAGAASAPDTNTAARQTPGLG